MTNNQNKYLEYVSKFAKTNKVHIWLGGSFLHGSATQFSDIDISVYCNNKKLHDLIYGYGKPIYISYTSKPLGILIIIYADGVALDLEIVQKVNIMYNYDYFHKTDIHTFDYIRNESIYRKFIFTDNTEYHISRLFHRSIVKFLSGKANIGVNIINEIVIFLSLHHSVNESDYKSRFPSILEKFNETFPLPIEYYKLLSRLIKFK